MYHLLPSLLVAIFVSASASLLGCFAILKRMALVGDAMSHVALPGIAIALLFNFNPFLGAAAFLLIAVFGIWVLENKTTLSTDTIVGVFFTTALAIGTLITPEQELLEALFGDISKLTARDAVISVIFAIILIVLLLVLSKKLALNMISQEIAHSIGIKTKLLDLAYLAIFALTVALGIRFVGALLMGSLVIIPAASAKNISRNLNFFLTSSVIFGIIGSVAGIYLSDLLHLPPGPIFILSTGVIFLVTLIIRAFRR
ncbi:MAG: metal ABC transporter permease [Patescibacteria group bacterium]